MWYNKMGTYSNMIDYTFYTPRDIQVIHFLLLVIHIYHFNFRFFTVLTINLQWLVWNRGNIYASTSSALYATWKFNFPFVQIFSRTWVSLSTKPNTFTIKKEGYIPVSSIYNKERVKNLILFLHVYTDEWL